MNRQNRTIRTPTGDGKGGAWGRDEARLHEARELMRRIHRHSVEQHIRDLQRG